MHAMLQLPITRAVAALCVALASVAAHADVGTRTETGGFALDKDVHGFDFDTLGLSNLRLWTTSYAGGQVDPVLALFDRQSGALLSLSDDVDAPFPQVDAGQGLLDAGIWAQDLAAGQYRVAVSVSPNLPLGSSWAEGYTLDGATGTFIDSSWTVRMELTNAAPVPEPTPVALLLAGLAGMGVLLQRRRPQTRVHGHEAHHPFNPAATARQD